MDHLATGKVLPDMGHSPLAYKTIALPGQELPSQFLPGDILLVRGWGEGSVFPFVLLNGDMVDRDRAYQVHFHPRAFRERYVEAIPLFKGPTPPSPMIKRIADENNRLLRDSLVLRWLPMQDVQLETETTTAVIEVSVRTDFLFSTGSGFERHFRPGVPIRNARVEINGTGINGNTNAQGRVRLDVSALTDGNYTLTLQHSNSNQHTTLNAGPDLAEAMANPPEMIFQPMTVHISVANKQLTQANVSAGTLHGGIGNANAHQFTAHLLPLDWKPVWWKAPQKRGEGVRSRYSEINRVIIHHTGGNQISGAINTFRNRAEIASIHYIIDLNGHTIKMNKDINRVNHAGCSRWLGNRGLNGSSLGIEIVHQSGPYPQAQYDALIQLLRAFFSKYQAHLPVRNLLGHSDIATEEIDDICTALMGTRRISDPGETFEWTRLEQLGWGMIPDSSITLGSHYGNYFASFSDPLRQNDSDTRSRYGGQVRTGIATTVVREIQTDLRSIGYSLNVNGVFDNDTLGAVRAFQKHFFSGHRRFFLYGGTGTFVAAQYNRELGRINLATATMIRQVLAAVTRRIAPAPAPPAAPVAPRPVTEFYAGISIADQIQTRCGFWGASASPVSLTDLQQSIVNAANDERQKWINPNTRQLQTEAVDPIFAYLVQYWLARHSRIPTALFMALYINTTRVNYAGLLALNLDASSPTLDAALDAIRNNLLNGVATGMTPPNLNTTINASVKMAWRSRLGTDDSFWSAVFVSSCIRHAAIQRRIESDASGSYLGRDELLLANNAHRFYLEEAYLRRFGNANQRKSGTYHAYGPDEVVIQPSDIIVQDRHSNIAIGQVFRFRDIPGIARDGRRLHADIVTEIENNSAIAIGGNLGNSVRRRRYPLNQQGRLVIDQSQVYTQESDAGVLPNTPVVVNHPRTLHDLSTSRIFAVLRLVEDCIAIPGQAVTGGTLI